MKKKKNQRKEERRKKKRGRGEKEEEREEKTLSRVKEVVKEEEKITFDVLPDPLRDLLNPVQRIVEVEEHGLDRRAAGGGERARHFFVFRQGREKLLALAALSLSKVSLSGLLFARLVSVSLRRL